MPPQDSQRQVRFNLDPSRDNEASRSRPTRTTSDRLPTRDRRDPQDPYQNDKGGGRPSHLVSHHSSYSNTYSHSINNSNHHYYNPNARSQYSHSNRDRGDHGYTPHHSRSTGSEINYDDEEDDDDDDDDEEEEEEEEEQNEDDDIPEGSYTSGKPALSPTSVPHHHAMHSRMYTRSPTIPEDGRPMRPLGPQRTPSSTYAPNRRPTPSQANNIYFEHHRPLHTRRRVVNPMRSSIVVQWRRRNGLDMRRDDSDSDGDSPTTDDTIDAEAVMFYMEENQEPTEEDYMDPSSAERLQWQGMLTTALSGDVIGQEKRRLTHNAKDADRIPADDLFIALRAARFQRHVSVQRKLMTDARGNLGQQLDEIMNFQVRGEDDADGKSPYEQIHDVVKKLERCESLYPSITYLMNCHQSAKSPQFTEATDAIMSWYNTVNMLNLELNVLRRWVGNENLVIERSEDGVAKEASSFVHRLLNDESLHTLYLGGADDEDVMYINDESPRPRRRPKYSTLEAVEQSQSDSDIPMTRLHKLRTWRNNFTVPPLGTRQDKNSEAGQGGGGILLNLFKTVKQVKRAMITHDESWRDRHLPPPFEELTTVINFPSRLLQTMLQEQVANARLANIKTAAQTNALILDQMIAQFKTLLRMSVEINQKYLEIIEPQENWSIPDTIDDTYQQDVFSALRFYFKMLNWKLSNNKNTFKEAEVLSQEWEFAHSIGGHFKNWEVELAEHFSHVTYKALMRLELTFEREMRDKVDESTAAMSKRIKACLDSVRVRQRMLQRFSRLLNVSYENCRDYSIPHNYDVLQRMFDNLVISGHVRLQTRFDAQGYVFIVSPAVLSDKKLDYVQVMMKMTSKTQIPLYSSETEGQTTPELQGPESGGDLDTPNNLLVNGPVYYLVIVRAEETPRWRGSVVALDLDSQPLDIIPGHLRLLAPSSDSRYTRANIVFQEEADVKLDVVNDRRSNLIKVNTKLTELRRVSYKVSNTVMDSVEIIRNETRGKGCEELIQTCFMSATEFGQRALQYMDENRRQMNNIKLSKLALDWVSFIDEDCKGADKRTFRWAMQALDFVSAMTRGRQILGLSDADWGRLRKSVSGCMAMLVQHLDVMGARSSVQAKAEAARKLEVYEKQTRMLDLHLKDDDEAGEMISEARLNAIRANESKWGFNDQARMGFGRVLQEANDLDRGLMDISSATNNGSLRWQIGQSLGSGAFGTVYVGVNLSRGQLMAVKEIRLQDPKSVLKIKHQIIREVKLLMALDHPNVVGCYGVEVRRDRVFIFMELCSGGSLAGLLEHGSLDDELALQELCGSMLDGLKYLHDRDIVHRDIKPANILLDHAGTVKFVDFGAAKILSRQSQPAAITLASPVPGASTEVVSSTDPESPHPRNTLASTHHGTTGTPMYMAPEVIRGEDQNAKASDVWSLGCVILELVTGQPPWPMVDNEYAIMFSIGHGQVPALPSETQMSALGRDFLSKFLKSNPAERATAEELLQHPWILQARDVDAETPSDSSTGGTPGQAMMSGIFPKVDQTLFKGKLKGKSKLGG